MKRNCPNCGAPVEIETSKCPYCKTSYFDFSAIEIDKDEPVFIKFKVGKETYTALAVLTSTEMERENPVIYADRSKDNVIIPYAPKCYGVSLNMGFRLIPFKGSKLKQEIMYIKEN